MSAYVKKKAAVHAFENKAEAMLAPLLEGDENSEFSDESSQYSSSTLSSISVEVKQTATQMLKTAAVSIGLLVGGVVSVGAMIINPVAAVFVMAGVCIAHAPYAAYKEYRIIKLPGLRSLNNALREDANHLEAEVDRLSEEIGILKPEAERASGVEEELREITNGQKYNVDKFVGLVRENETILNAMRDNLRERIVQDIFKIVMSSDKNNDGRFCKVETKMLVLKISLALQEYGVEFDEAKFYKVMSNDPSVAQTVMIVKRLIPSLNEEYEAKSDSEEESEEDDGDHYDMFHMTADSSLTASIGGKRLSLSVKPKKLSSQTSGGVQTANTIQAATHWRRLAKRNSRRKSEAQRSPDAPPIAATPSSSTRVRKRDKLKKLLKGQPSE